MYYLITLKRRNSSHGDTMGLAMSRSFGDAIAHGNNFWMTIFYLSTCRAGRFL